jgi:hypothetical protein
MFQPTGSLSRSASVAQRAASAPRPDWTTAVPQGIEVTVDFCDRDWRLYTSAGMVVATESRGTCGTGEHPAGTVTDFYHSDTAADLGPDELVELRELLSGFLAPNTTPQETQRLQDFVGLIDRRLSQSHP